MNPQNVHLFVFDGLSDWETGYAASAIHNPRFQKNPGRYRICTVAAKAETIVTMGGIRIVPDTTLDQLTLQDSAMLILPGGDVWESGGNPEAIDTARAQYGRELMNRRYEDLVVALAAQPRAPT